MKIVLCSSHVPFTFNEEKNFVEWLGIVLQQNGNQVERISLPQANVPDLLFQQMAAYRWVNLSAADRIICFRPHAHLIPHRHKILWFIDPIRAFYDGRNSAYCDSPDDIRLRGIRDALHTADTTALQEAKRIFTNSKAASAKLKHFNKMESEVLYPPIFQPDRFYCRSFSDEIISIAPLEYHQRQHFLVESMQYTKTPVRLRLCGLSVSHDYTSELLRLIAQLGLEKKVTLVERCITASEKIELLADSLAAAYIPVDADSYGYSCVEANHSGKPVLTTSDSGAVCELVEHNFNGFITDPNPKAFAEAIDQLYKNRKLTQNMGENAKRRLFDLNINWSYVLTRLLS